MLSWILNERDNLAMFHCVVCFFFSGENAVFRWFRSQARCAYLILREHGSTSTRSRARTSLEESREVGSGT